jgi:hypothetical protein
MEKIEFPAGLLLDTGITRWRPVMTGDGAFSALVQEGVEGIKRLAVLDDERLDGRDGDGKGLYIWIAGDGSGRHRFVHVGISERGGSTLARRTRVHLRAQLTFTDRIHRINWDLSADEFGMLGPDLRTDEALRHEAAYEFLRNLRILFLLPDGDESRNRLRTLEGAISHAAAHLLDVSEERKSEDDWETTNTLSKHSRWAASPDNSRSIAELLNRCGVRMLPVEARKVARR